MKTSEVFRRVKLHLLDEGYMMAHERYICYALNELYMSAKIGDRDRTRCKKIVMDLLHPVKSLEAWLCVCHNKEITNTSHYKKRIMATRKAWLDHLINHYEAKGD